MDNPFKKRRTELITDRRTMLSLVSPTPIEEFFRVERRELLDKLTMVVGTPGCGKTTIAQVVEFESLATLCAPDSGQPNNELVDVLITTGLIHESRPTLVGHRLSMTTNFRDIWELPYQEATRTALLRAFVQAKAVLGWFRQFEASNLDLSTIKVVTGHGADSLREVTHADDAIEFRAYARKIELAIFKVVTALVPPTEQELASDFLNTRFDIFEVLTGFLVRDWPSATAAKPVMLRPMVIVDDAHELHPTQFLQLRDWLKSKAMGISRWLMCRPDVVSPEDYRDAMAHDARVEDGLAPGSTVGRDYLIKLMQLGSRDARRFKPIARDIARRYLSAIPEFARHGVTDLKLALDQGPASISEGQIKQLKETVEKMARDARFSAGLLDTLRRRVPPGAREDEALGVLRILVQREDNRTPQLALLPDDSVREEPLTDDRKAVSSLVDGARIQLMHQFDRPYYYGIDKLIGASNVNIEQFIRLAGCLVDELLARVIRGKSIELSPRNQHRALVAQAKRTMAEWDFPYHAAVRTLIDQIAKRCVERTLQPNAPLDNGANAIGVPQEEMDRVLQRSERLTRVLHFAFAYKALVFVPQYRCKNRDWCLLELGAIPSMAYGLTLSRGGFIEDTLSGLQTLVPG